ncbi:MAG: hypothetical protein R3F61_17745 [Myxococcota bacterium]
MQPMLARGLRSEPAAMGVNDLEGAVMPDRAGSIVVVRCPSAFVVDPERPEALWSCESRALVCTPPK